MPTLIVEDGSKPANANSYCSLEYADDYHDLVGNEDWASMTDDEKTRTLIQATESLDLLYGQKYLSQRYNDPQSLLWPRYAFVDQNKVIRVENAIPVELQKAVSMLALDIYNGVDPYPVPNQNASIKKQKTKVDVLEIETEYMKPVATETYEGFNRVELLLGPILKTKGGNSISLGR